MIRAWFGAFAFLLAGPGRSAAQSVEALVTEGRQMARVRPGDALRLFEHALQQDSRHYEANWRAAVALVDLGQETADEEKSLARDSLYARAETHARRAIEADTLQAEGYFALSLALGRVALTRGTRDRLRYAAEIRGTALRALALDPGHDGAHHILGLWNAEAMRVSGLSRFLARKLLGGGVLGQASWDSAISHLTEAVRLDSTRIYHRLDLARVLVDRKRYAAARQELHAIAELPDREQLDWRYRREANALLMRIEGKADKNVKEEPSG